jgi:hypothetical protein
MGPATARNSTCRGYQPEKAGPSTALPMPMQSARYQQPIPSRGRNDTPLPSLSGRDSVRARHTGLLSPPGCSCLAGRSAFPQQRKIKAGTSSSTPPEDTGGPNSSEIVANTLSRNLFPFHRSSLHCLFPLALHPKGESTLRSCLASFHPTCREPACPAQFLLQLFFSGAV